jgi:PAS domain S-box-containing protein
MTRSTLVNSRMPRYISPVSSLKKVVLLVEDEAIIALQEKMLLEREGYAVITCGSGEEAVRIASEDPSIDLLLMDIDLGPGMDGTDAARRILATRDVPVLFVSSHTEPEVVARTEEITSYGYVVKNSTPTVLFASIKMAFKLHAAERRVEAERDNLLQIMSVTPVGILVVRSDLSVSRMNPAAEEMTARTLQTAETEAMVELDGKRGGSNDSGSKLPTRRRMRCGDLLGCVNRRHSPRICGESAFCGDCTLNRDIRETISRGTRVRHREAEFLLAATTDDGEERRVWLRYSTAPIILDGEGAALVTFEDVTERRSAAERMRLLARIAESESTLVVVTDRERRTIWANPAFWKLTGYPPEEFLGRNPGDVLQGEAPDLTLKGRITTALDAGTSFQGEILNYTRQGTPYWIHMDIQPVFDEAGTLTHFVSVQRDITSEREYRQDLEKRDVRLHALAARTTDGIVVMDAEGRITAVNPAYSRMIGRPPEETVGMTADEVFDRMHPEDAAFLRDKLYGALAEGVSGMVYRFRLERGDGDGYIWLEDRATCFYEADGAIEESFIFSREISDLHPERASFRVTE